MKNYTKNNHKVVRDRLDRSLQAWARWVETGKQLNYGGFKDSVLAHLGEVRGQPPEHALEQSIEALVLHLATSSPKKADILRMEYGAGWQELLRRHGYNVERPPDLSKQHQRAHFLGYPLRTYKYQLNKIRHYINENLYG